jgi:hypothetical protein
MKKMKAKQLLIIINIIVRKSHFLFFQIPNLSPTPPPSLEQKKEMVRIRSNLPQDGRDTIVFEKISFQ